MEVIGTGLEVRNGSNWNWAWICDWDLHLD